MQLRNTIAFRFGIHHKTVKRILKHELGLVKVNFEWIPYWLADNRKQERIGIATELLHFVEASSSQTLSRVFTGDESWYFLDNLRNFIWEASAVF
jgi:hypothetical protein